LNFVMPHLASFEKEHNEAIKKNQITQSLIFYAQPKLPTQEGELAQLVERVLSMHEVAGSIPAFSRV
jgi:hypothetical protein